MVDGVTEILVLVFSLIPLAGGSFKVVGLVFFWLSTGAVAFDRNYFVYLLLTQIRNTSI